MKQEKSTILFLQVAIFVLFGWNLISAINRYGIFTDQDNKLQSLDQTLSKEICERKGGTGLYGGLTGEFLKCQKNGIIYDWQNSEWINETKNVLEADRPATRGTATGTMKDFHAPTDQYGCYAGEKHYYANGMSLCEMNFSKTK